jgi:hypothetical protein
MYTSRNAEMCAPAGASAGSMRIKPHDDENEASREYVKVSSLSPAQAQWLPPPADYEHSTAQVFNISTMMATP